MTAIPPVGSNFDQGLSDPIRQLADGWHFYDEASDDHGPFESMEAAKAALDRYVAEALRERDKVDTLLDAHAEQGTSPTGYSPSYMAGNRGQFKHVDDDRDVITLREPIAVERIDEGYPVRVRTKPDDDAEWGPWSEGRYVPPIGDGDGWHDRPALRPLSRYGRNVALGQPFVGRERAEDIAREAELRDAIARSEEANAREDEPITWSTAARSLWDDLKRAIDHSWQVLTGRFF